MTAGDYLLRRGRAWYYNRKPPACVAHLDRRDRIRFSIGKTKNLSEADARAKVRAIDQQMTSYWDALLVGDEGRAQRAAAEARLLAARLGVAYKTTPELLSGDVDDLISRVLRIKEMTPPGRPPAEDLVDALLGGVDGPAEEAEEGSGAGQGKAMRLSALRDWYFENAQEAKAGKSEQALRGWRVRRTSAFQILIDAVGDVSTNDLTRDDLMAMRAALWERVERDEIKRASANRRINDITGMLSLAEDRLGLTLPPRAKLRFSTDNEEADTPPAFPTDWIERKFLADGALDALAPEARGIFLAMVETGARPSELCNLLPEHIVLDAEIPHIQIRPTREAGLKTKSSRRDIPLVGVSLMALKANPNGFESYRYRPNSLSGYLNKRLRELGLMPSDSHTAYSMRHAFEERSWKIEPPERVWNEIFGHAYKREKYGKVSLAQKRDLIEKLALRPPSRV